MPQPSSWPSANATYIASPVPSQRLSEEHRARYCGGPPSVPAAKLRIQRIDNKTHPAHGQHGLFNGGKALAPRSWILDYVGLVHYESEADQASDYDLALHRTATEVIGVDATAWGNEARFVNDYRGILPRPNSEFSLRTFRPAGPRGPEQCRMAIYAGPHGVPKHAEICVSYGRGFWSARTETG